MSRPCRGEGGSNDGDKAGNGNARRRGRGGSGGPDGRRSARARRPARRRARCEPEPGPQVPARGTGRPQPHPFRAASDLADPLWRGGRAPQTRDRGLSARGAAALGGGTRRGDVRRQQRPRFPEELQSHTAAARLAETARRPRRRAQGALALCRIWRWRQTALRFAGRRRDCRGGGRRLRAGRRVLAAARRRWRLGRNLPKRRHRSCAIKAGQLRLSRRMVGRRYGSGSREPR